MADPGTVGPNVGGPNLQNQYHGGVFRTRKLRDAMGPDDPLYHLLMRECVRDIYPQDDDFPGALRSELWTASNSGAGAASFAQLTAAGDINGVIQGDAGTDDDGDSTLLGEEVWTADHRPVAIFRVYMASAVADSKFEVGFIDGDAAGAVLVKDTPSRTATDFAVVIRDIDDDTSVDLVTGGTTDGVTLTASSPGITFATTTWYDIMIAINEQREVAFWIDSVFQGVSRAGPENDLTTLALWAFVQNREDSNNRQLNLDYIFAWQERTRLPHSV